MADYHALLRRFNSTEKQKSNANANTEKDFYTPVRAVLPEHLRRLASYRPSPSPCATTPLEDALEAVRRQSYAERRAHATHVVLLLACMFDNVRGVKHLLAVAAPCVESHSSTSHCCISWMARLNPP